MRNFGTMVLCADSAGEADLVCPDAFDGVVEPIRRETFVSSALLRIGHGMTRYPYTVITDGTVQLRKGWQQQILPLLNNRVLAVSAPASSEGGLNGQFIAMMSGHLNSIGLREGIESYWEIPLTKDILGHSKEIVVKDFACIVPLDHPERDDAMGDLYYSFIEDYETAKEL
jgi:hypothetical protein